MGAVLSAFIAVTVGSLVRALLSEEVATGLVAALAAVVLVAELLGRRLPLPQNARQVPRSIAYDDPRWGPFQFGFEMGTGVRTFVPTGLPHVLALAVALVAPWPLALVAGVGFGLGRAFMSTTRTRSGDTHWWDRHYLAGRRRDVAVLSVVVVLAVARILGMLG